MKEFILGSLWEVIDGFYPSSGHYISKGSIFEVKVLSDDGVIFGDTWFKFKICKDKLKWLKKFENKECKGE